MSTNDAAVRKALSSQEDLIGRREHCSVDARLLAAAGATLGQQIRIRRTASEYGLFTVSEVRDEDAADVVRLGLTGRRRLGTDDVFAGAVVLPAADPTMSDAEAEAAGELVERLDDDGEHRGLIVIAPHGGDIEPHTDEQAERVATVLRRYRVSVWRCKGWKGQREGGDGGAFECWHTTSTDIDPSSYPGLGSVIDRGFTHAVAFHGFGDADVLIGGTASASSRSRSASEIEAAISGSGIVVRVAGPGEQYGGDDPRNIVNRLAAGGVGGIQIEQSLAARRDHGPAIADAVAAVFGRQLRPTATERGAIASTRSPSGSARPPAGCSTGSGDGRADHVPFGHGSFGLLVRVVIDGGSVGAWRDDGQDLTMSAGERLPATPEPMYHWTTAGGLALAGDVWGDGDGPLVVLQHGGGQTRHAWKGTGEVLARAGYRVVAFDARGHGDSDWAPDGDYTQDAQVDDLVSVLDQVGGESPVLVGASMGGGTTLVAVGEGHVDAAAVVLVDIAPRLELEGVAKISAFMNQGADGFASLEEVADAIAAYQPHRPRPRQLDGLAKNVRLGEDGRYRWHWDPVFRSGFRDLDERHKRLEACARNLDVPTLLVRGGLSDILTEEGVEEFLRMCPSAEYVSIPDAAHMVAGDRNDVFGDAVVEFLVRHVPISEPRPPVSRATRPCRRPTTHASSTFRDQRVA